MALGTTGFGLFFLLPIRFLEYPVFLTQISPGSAGVPTAGFLYRFSCGFSFFLSGFLELHPFFAEFSLGFPRFSFDLLFFSSDIFVISF